MNPIIWPDKTTEIPSDLRVKPNNCNNANAKLSSLSLGILFTICIGLLFFLGALTLIMWHKYYHEDFPNLTKKKLIQLGDLIAILGIFIDFCQYLNITSEIDGKSALLYYLDKLFSIDIVVFDKFSEELFWPFINSTLSIAFICPIFGLFSFEKFRTMKSEFFWYLSKFSRYYLVLFANLLFLPVFSSIIDIFVCSKSIDNEFILDKDCNQIC